MTSRFSARRIDQAGAKIGVKLDAIQVAPDKNQLVAPLFAQFSGPVGFAAEEHMNALKTPALGHVFDGHNAFHAKNILAFVLQ